MEPRVRWHRSDCIKPDITVDHGVPQCHNCNANASTLLARLVAENQATRGIIEVPVEAPLGSANLWWPPSVPYCTPPVDTGTVPSKDQQRAIMHSETNARPSPTSSVYASSLDSTRFRLIYLTESEESSSPIHIRLEEYALDDHPVYEAVSYLWGGENGDSTLCQPVYVGSFWDIILVTSNCSALLHHLRPLKGCRIVWLDAVCINQANNVEKSAQISKMSDIYAGCEHVVVYFGQDLVQQPPGRLFRPRIMFEDIHHDKATRVKEKTAKFLHTCADSAGISKERLLHRRYLSRIWIVQELVLPRKAILPLGHSDIVCNRDLVIELALRTKGQRLAVDELRGSLSHLLAATSQCEAGDPRDRIYGLLGLFRPRDASLSLASDYSLSWRDCWVGIGAYIILVEKNIVLLVHAMGKDCPPQVPSWAPDIRNTGSWFLSLSATVDDQDTQVSNDSHDTNEMEEGVSSEWATEFVMFSEDQHEQELKKWEPSNWWAKNSHRLVHPGELYSMSLEEASVDSSNGSLQIRALRVFDGPQQLTIETGKDGIILVWAQGPSTAARFLIKGLKHLPTENEQFEVLLISDQSGSSGRVLFALAAALSAGSHNFVALHDCCVLHDLRFYSMDRLPARLESIQTMTNELHNLHWVLQTLQPVPISHLWHLHSDSNWIYGCIFPSDEATTRQLLPLLTRLLQLERPLRVSEALVESIRSTAEVICPSFDPLIRGNYFHLTVKNTTMFETWLDQDRQRAFFRFGLDVHVREAGPCLEVNHSNPFVDEEEKWESLIYHEKQGKIRMSNTQWREFWDGQKLPFTVRIPLDSVVSRIQGSELYTTMCYAQEFSNLLNEDLEALIARSPIPEDRLIFLEGWEGLVKDLGLAWKTEMITIV